MRRREFVTVAGIGTATVLSGCISQADGEGDQGTTVEELDVDQMSVEQVRRNTIRVSGVGSVETDPDEVTFTVAVESSDRDDASAVVEDLAERAEALRQALLDYGLDDEDVTTDSYRLREDSRSNRYEGEHSYRVELDDTDVVGEVIDLCVDAGADSIGRIDFTVSEDRREELYDEAVDRAVGDARDEAELYANAAGKSLGEPTSIETTRTDHRPFRQHVDVAFAESADDGDAATQIDSGQVAVTAEITIEYEFE